MKTTHLIVVGALVGAICLAPTKLPLAQAAIKAVASTSTLNVSTKSYGAVAGSSSAATTPAAYLLPALISSCSASRNTQGTTSSGSTTVNMSGTTGYVVGMAVTAVGITPGAVINSILNSPNRIVISIATTASIPNGTAIAAVGCWQSYFSVNNIQSTALISFGVQQTFSSVSPRTVTMQRCAGTWNEATGACTGAITTIVSGSVTSALTTAPIALVATTGTARLRILSTKNVVSVTISVFIRRAIDVAAGTTTNS
jgi:hypothetical protein